MEWGPVSGRDQREGLDLGRQESEVGSGRVASSRAGLNAETCCLRYAQLDPLGCRATSSDGVQVCEGDAVASLRTGVQEKGRTTPPGVARQHGQSGLQQDRDGTS